MSLRRTSFGRAFTSHGGSFLRDARTEVTGMPDSGYIYSLDFDQPHLSFIYANLGREYPLSTPKALIHTTSHNGQ
jgi:hypothetical protein